MSGGWVDVDTGELRAHARRVRDLTRDVDVAAAAAAQVRLGPGSLGLLCTPLIVPLMAPVESAGHAAISLYRSSLNGTARSVEAAADTYDAADDAVHELWTKIKGLL